MFQKIAPALFSILNRTCSLVCSEGIDINTFNLKYREKIKSNQGCWWDKEKYFPRYVTASHNLIQYSHASNKENVPDKQPKRVQ